MKAKTLLEFIKKDFKDFEKYVYFTKEMVDTALEDIDSLEQQNTGLQARIKELEANEDKLKREWYTIGSNDNYNALKNSGKIRI